MISLEKAKFSQWLFFFFPKVSPVYLFSHSPYILDSGCTNFALSSLGSPCVELLSQPLGVACMLIFVATTAALWGRFGTFWKCQHFEKTLFFLNWWKIKVFSSSSHLQDSNGSLWDTRAWADHCFCLNVLQHTPCWAIPSSRKVVNLLWLTDFACTHNLGWLHAHSHLGRSRIYSLTGSSQWLLTFMNESEGKGVANKLIIISFWLKCLNYNLY